MKKKVIWLVLSGGMVLTLLLSACAPAVVEQEKEVVPKEEVVTPREEVVPRELVVPSEETNLVKWTGTKADGTVVEKMLEKPKYGGAHITSGPADPLHANFFDSTRTPGSGSGELDDPVYEPLLHYDWLRGPAGTGEWGGQLGIVPPPRGWEAGIIAESYELPDPNTFIFHIRRGIRFALDPTSEASRLVGGREMTADDVVFSLRHHWKTGYPSVQPVYRDAISDPKNPDNSFYVSPTDKWAVVVKMQPGQTAIFHRQFSEGWSVAMAPEVIGKYGPTITDWRHIVGTGPFILKNYITASSITFARNPDYWGHDPFFPENQLPYVDGFKLLIIPDLSTQMAALRTGKIDNLPSAGVDSPPIIDVETAQSLMKTNPELQWVRYLSNAQGGKINMRVDTKPFDDIQVRRALQLAVNQPEILELYWGGDGVLFNWPVYASLEYSPFYKPLEDYPESVRELYEYHPDKARQLLTEAGYPNGFKTSVVALNTHVDLLSVIKEYWAKIGVDLTIDVKSSTVHRTMLARKQHTEMIMADGVSGPGLVWTADIRKGGGQNYSILDEPWWEVAYYRMVETYFDPGTYGGFVPAIHEPLAPDQPTWAVYTNEQSWWINLPAPYLYTFWQPWLKNYYGAMMTYYGSSLGWTRYAWIDQELKKAMGH